MRNFSSFISDISEETKLIADTNQDYNNASEHISSEQSTCILIGPEGGFTDEEICSANSKSFQSVSFGSSIMRTETAAIHACSIIKNVT